MFGDSKLALNVCVCHKIMGSSLTAFKIELACNIVEIKFFVWLISEKQKQHVRLIDIEYNHLQKCNT